MAKAVVAALAMAVMAYGQTRVEIVPQDLPGPRGHQVIELQVCNDSDADAIVYGLDVLNEAFRRGVGVDSNATARRLVDEENSSGHAYRTLIVAEVAGYLFGLADNTDAIKIKEEWRKYIPIAAGGIRAGTELIKRERKPMVVPDNYIRGIIGLKPHTCEAFTVFGTVGARSG